MLLLLFFHVVKLKTSKCVFVVCAVAVFRIALTKTRYVFLGEREYFHLWPFQIAKAFISKLY